MRATFTTTTALFCHTITAPHVLCGSFKLHCVKSQCGSFKSVRSNLCAPVGCKVWQAARMVGSQAFLHHKGLDTLNGGIIHQRVKMPQERWSKHFKYVHHGRKNAPEFRKYSSGYKQIDAGCFFRNVLLNALIPSHCSEKYFTDE